MSKLLTLAKESTKLVDETGAKFYWEVDDHPYKFYNKHLARWYENEYGVWSNFVDRSLSSIKENLKDKSIDYSIDYNSIFLKKIREKYDYVRLLFSGGSDSRTVFDTAINNKIYIDELISIYK